MTDKPDWPLEPGPQDLRVDTAALRTLAHPVRLRLLGLLREQGPSTASRLAERLGLNSGATSYHLRRLAAGGLIVEDTERGSARDRWWRAAHRSSYFDVADVPAEEIETAASFFRAIAFVHADRVQRAVDEFPLLPSAWQQASNMSDSLLRLTAPELERLGTELAEVISRYRRADDTAPPPPGSAPVAVQFQAFPIPGSPDSPQRTEETP